jgi:large subunit ribosomal protein L13Ae
MDFKRKGMNSNPRRGQFHYRAPSKIFWRVVRGMIPHKTARGAAALDRMTTFEGVPHPYDRKKKMVIPQALKVLRLKPHRKYCKLGDLSNSVGWKYQNLIGRLEEKRSVKNAAFHKRTQALNKVKKTALKGCKKETIAALEKLGQQ